MQINNTSQIAASTAQSQSNSDLLAQSTIYSTSIAGRTYTADLTLTAGEYIATVPGLPSVSANGSTMVQAENDLAAHIRLLA
jgi:hypothetical protein